MTNLTKILMLISTLVLVIGGGFSFYLTYKSYQPVALTNENAAGIAIDGFDAVAYHTAGRAQRGDHKYQVSWNDAVWYFATLENRQRFSADPERFAPQFGGYDPYGVAINGAAQPAAPELWEIQSGKLYLFYSAETRTLWRERREQNIRAAHDNWARIRQQIAYQTKMK